MTADAAPAPTVAVGVGPLTVDDVVAVARARRAGRARPTTRSPRSTAARAVVEALADDARPRTTASRPASARSPPGTSRPRCAPSCSARLVRSHAAGSGPEVEREVVRALMLLRLSTLATGRTGVRPETRADATPALLNAGITPVVREYGSLGCSGDLAPLSHCALALMGEGEVRDADGTLRAGRRGARRRRARRPVELAREGGPRPHQRHRRHARHAGAGARRPARRCCDVADVAAAMSVEGLLGTDRVFAADLQALRPHPGQAAVAPPTCARCSPAPAIVASHRGPDCTRVQDAYSLRCSPAGARRRPRHRRRTPRRVAGARAGRARSTTRSSLPDGRVESNGNFHGAPVALRARLPRDRRRRRRLDQRAAHRPVPRRRPQPRAAAVPRRRPRRRLAAT